MECEKRLIDLDKLIESLKATKVSECYPEWNDMTTLSKAVVLKTIRAYREIVLNQPIVDAIIPVYCRDCEDQTKVWIADRRRKNGGHWVCSCDRNEDPFTPHAVYGEDSEFCCYGKKRGGTE